VDVLDAQSLKPPPITHLADMLPMASSVCVVAPFVIMAMVALTFVSHVYGLSTESIIIQPIPFRIDSKSHAGLGMRQSKKHRILADGIHIHTYLESCPSNRSHKKPPNFVEKFRIMASSMYPMPGMWSGMKSNGHAT